MASKTSRLMTTLHELLLGVEVPKEFSIIGEMVHKNFVALLAGIPHAAPGRLCAYFLRLVSVTPKAFANFS